MAFSILPYEEIYKQIRYSTTEGSTLLAYTEALEDGPGMQDKLLWKGKNGRFWLSIQKPKKYKWGDGSVKVIPLNKEDAVRIYNDLAVHVRLKISETESTDIFNFDEVIKA